jgi:oligoendopeptidase F
LRPGAPWGDNGRLAPLPGNPGGPALTADRATVPAREDLDPAFRWRLDHIFASPEDWQREIGRVEEVIAELAARAGTLASGTAALVEALELHARLGESLDRVYVWAHLFRDQDTREPDAQARAERAARLATQAAEAGSFLEPEILAIPADRLESFRGDPAAADWRHYLGNLLRMKAHTLSPREEEILAMAGEVTRVPRTVFGMLNDADLTFRPIRDEQGREVELTKGRYSAFLESLDRRVRRDAWTSLTEGYEQHRNTLAALLAGSVKRDCFYARVRGYSSALQSALFPNNVPESVFHTLVDTVARRRAAIHRAMELRRRVLGLESLEVYDLYVPLSTAEAPRYSYEDARDVLVKGLTPLGADYLAAMRQGLDGGGWVDVYESRGKRSGAYSWSTYGTHPYVLMNYQGTLDHLFTLAHEMGHAMHSWYTHREQPYHYSHYPIFLAEVASTTNEAILMDHLLKVTEDPDGRLALLNQYIDQIRGTVVTQVMFADFEQRIHAMVERGEPLTSDILSDVYREIFTATLGPAVAFDERAALGWARIPHFYSGYYVYQYATGYAAATALSRRVLAGGPREREEYLGFLRAGDSDYPIEILRRAGVDLARPEPVNDTLDLFESLLDQLEAHIAKHGTAAAPTR